MTSLCIWNRAAAAHIWNRIEQEPCERVSNKIYADRRNTLNPAHNLQQATPIRSLLQLIERPAIVHFIPLFYDSDLARESILLPFSCIDIGLQMYALLFAGPIPPILATAIHLHKRQPSFFYIITRLDDKGEDVYLEGGDLFFQRFRVFAFAEIAFYCYAHHGRQGQNRFRVGRVLGFAITLAIFYLSPSLLTQKCKISATPLLSPY